ncbi:MAG: hypothetical protein U0350_09450 [Caldilineaceae bacterium]
MLTTIHPALAPAWASQTVVLQAGVNGYAGLTDTKFYNWLKVEAPGGPASVRFLHVLQGLDAGANASPATLIESSSGVPFAGAVVNNTAVLFPVEWGAAFTGVTYSTPAGVTNHIVTGLTPNAGYNVTKQTVNGQTQVTITPNGNTIRADSGGVLVFTGQAQAAADAANNGPFGLQHVYLPVINR